MNAGKLGTAIGESHGRGASALAFPRRAWERENVPTPRPRGLLIATLTVLTAAAVAAIWWFDPAQIPLPICGFHATTGLHCPGCGATRATHELLHGRFLGALHYNALWICTLPLAVYMGISELGLVAVGRPLPGNLPCKPWLFVALGAIAVLFFVLRNLPFYPFLLLAPPG
jgi:hypothetical protein